MATMKSETRICKNCKNQFVIESGDFDFYEKVNVPPPTFCPDCRMQRRMVLRNERVLYKRTCSLCAKELISAYPQDTPFPVYCQTCWWSDKWEGMQYGKEYDVDHPFFEQFKELQDNVPRQHANNYSEERLINSPYANCSGDIKNCYLVFGSQGDEDSLYSHYLSFSKNCVDTLYTFKSEWCYECIDVESCYGVFYSQSSVACRDSWFLFDCRNCNDCIGCVGLRNKQYYILNKLYTKEEYEKEKASLKLNTRKGIERFRHEFLTTLFYRLPRKFYHGKMNNQFSGDYIANSEHSYSSFYTQNARGSKFLFWCINALDVYDYFAWGDLELCYECVSGGERMYQCKFTHTAWTNLRNVEYASLCFSSSNLFGCIGLRNKQYCILNKQYSEEEYQSLREKIIKDMNEKRYIDARGMSYPYGENFAIELSPFPYADTVAQEHFPLTEEEIKKHGYVWRETQDKKYAPTREAHELPETIEKVDDAILNDVIACGHGATCHDLCTGAFKITDAELQFYRHQHIPLPRLCSNCRHGERVKQRNPLKLWKRPCACAGITSRESESKPYQNTAKHFHGERICPNTFETSYATDRQEIVYCEQCYNAEVA